MTNEELARHLDWVNTVECREAARRLRGPDYRAEAMAAREFIRGDGRGRDYLTIRTTNESKEAANG